MQIRLPRPYKARLLATLAAATVWLQACSPGNRSESRDVVLSPGVSTTKDVLEAKGQPDKQYPAPGNPKVTILEYLAHDTPSATAVIHPAPSAPADPPASAPAAAPATTAPAAAPASLTAPPADKEFLQVEDDVLTAETTPPRSGTQETAIQYWHHKLLFTPTAVSAGENGEMQLNAPEERIAVVYEAGTGKVLRIVRYASKFAK